MNALWISRIAEYKYSSLAILTARNILFHKIQCQNDLLKRYNQSCMLFPGESPDTFESILLLEARFAKNFWKGFRNLLAVEYGFLRREPHSQDVVNRLLDIGYHHLANKVTALLEENNVSAEIGLFHTAHTAVSKPLVYDLMELFRSDVIDREVIRFLRLKKIRVTNLNSKDVAQFLNNVNTRLQKKFYLEKFSQCHTYEYFMMLQILHFISAVNHKKVFIPLRIPRRHEHRCP